MYPVFLSPVCGEIIHWNLHALSLLELSQGGHQQLEVERPRVVKVVVVLCCQELLLWR